MQCFFFNQAEVIPTEFDKLRTTYPLLQHLHYFKWNLALSRHAHASQPILTSTIYLHIVLVETDVYREGKRCHEINIIHTRKLGWNFPNITEQQLIEPIRNLLLQIILSLIPPLLILITATMHIIIIWINIKK